MIEFKYFERVDFPQLINWIDTPEFMLQWGGSDFQFPLTEEQLIHYTENANHEKAKNLIYSVIDKESKKVIGHISLGSIDQKNKSARIGRVLVGDKQARGRGIGQLMMKEIARIAFEDIGLHRVSLGVFAFNKPALTCYTKVGFVREGVLRDARKINNEYWNLIEMSMLEDEWLSKKE